MVSIKNERHLCKVSEYRVSVAQLQGRETAGPDSQLIPQVGEDHRGFLAQTSGCVQCLPRSVDTLRDPQGQEEIP